MCGSLGFSQDRTPQNPMEDHDFAPWNEHNLGPSYHHLILHGHGFNHVKSLHFHMVSVLPPKEPWLPSPPALAVCPHLSAPGDIDQGGRKFLLSGRVGFEFVWVSVAINWIALKTKKSASSSQEPWQQDHWHRQASNSPGASFSTGGITCSAPYLNSCETQMGWTSFAIVPGAAVAVWGIPGFQGIWWDRNWSLDKSLRSLRQSVCCFLCTAPWRNPSPFLRPAPSLAGHHFMAWNRITLVAEY